MFHLHEEKLQINNSPETVKATTIAIGLLIDDTCPDGETAGGIEPTLIRDYDYRYGDVSRSLRSSLATEKDGKNLLRYFPTANYHWQLNLTLRFIRLSRGGQVGSALRLYAVECNII
jgi:hypothetical protein